MRRSLIRPSESRAVDWYINEFSTTLNDGHGAMGQEGRRSQAGQLGHEYTRARSQSNNEPRDLGLFLKKVEKHLAEIQLVTSYVSQCGGGEVEERVPHGDLVLPDGPGPQGEAHYSDIDIRDDPETSETVLIVLGDVSDRLSTEYDRALPLLSADLITLML